MGFTVDGLTFDGVIVAAVGRQLPASSLPPTSRVGSALPLVFTLMFCPSLHANSSDVGSRQLVLEGVLHGGIMIQTLRSNPMIFAAFLLFAPLAAVGCADGDDAAGERRR